jgi:hypothetical protein
MTFIINMAFELYAISSNMPDWIYRLLFIRYLFAFGLGIWLFYGVDRRLLLIGGIMSFIYITAIDYFGCTPLGQPSWGSSNALSFIWPLMLVVIGLRALPNITLISEIGKASFHIFLVQMIYFWAIGNLINTFLGDSFVNNIIICILVGLLFYYFSQIVASKVTKLKHKE